MEVQPGAVSSDNGLHDGEAEAEAVVLACAIAGEALEGLEKTVELVWGYDRPGVGDHECGLPVLGLDYYLDVAVGMVVPDGVVDKVRDEPFDEVDISGERSGKKERIESYPLGFGGRLAGVEDLAGDRRQVERLAVIEASLAAGQGEEGFDELFLLLAVFEEVLANRSVGLDGCVGVAQDHFEEGAFDGDRGA